jgi:hypothetical protein
MMRSIVSALTIVVILAMAQSRPAIGQGSYGFKQAWPVKWSGGASSPSRLLPAVQKQKRLQAARSGPHKPRVEGIKGETRASGRKPHEIVVVGTPSRSSAKPRHTGQSSNRVRPGSSRGR